VDLLNADDDIASSVILVNSTHQYIARNEECHGCQKYYNRVVADDIALIGNRGRWMQSTSFDPACMPVLYLHAVGIRMVTIDCEWMEVFFQRKWTVGYVSYALEHDITFKNVRVTFQDPIVRTVLYRTGGWTGGDPLEQGGIDYYQF